MRRPVAGRLLGTALPLLAILWVMETVAPVPAASQGLVPRGRGYDYTLLADSSTVRLEIFEDYADSTLYTDVDSLFNRFDDVIVAQWGLAYEDSLRRWYRNTDPEDPLANEIQLVGYSRPGLRILYEPPLPLVPSITELETGATWTWSGRVWPPEFDTLPDTLYFQSEILEPVDFLDGSSLPAWKLRLQESASFPIAGGGRVDLTGARLPDGAKRFDPIVYWYGAFNDGGPHRLRMRDGKALLDLDQSTPVRRESMGRLRARFGGDGGSR